MSRKISLVLVSLIALVLAACGGGAAGGGGGGGTALDQTFSQDGITFKYPSGWVASSEAGQAFMANSQDAMTRLQQEDVDVPTLNAGDRGISIVTFDAEMVSAMGETSPLSLLQSMTGGSAQAIGATLGEPVETTIGGKPAARVSGTTEALDIEYVVVNHDASGYIIVFGVTPKGEMSSLQPTITAVAESVTVEPVAVG